MTLVDCLHGGARRIEDVSPRHKDSTDQAKLCIA